MNPANWIVEFLRWTWAGLDVKPHPPGKFDEFEKAHPVRAMMIVIAVFTGLVIGIGLLLRVAT